MVLGIISTIFSSLGIYGFFTGNLFLLYFGMLCVIIEHIIGIISKQEKGLATVFIALIVSIILMINGTNWLQAIAICLCFEGTICFILGCIMMILVGNKMKSASNDNSNVFSDTEKQEIIRELMDKSNLSKEICSTVFDILVLFKANYRDYAYKKIEKELIPLLEHEKSPSNVGVAFGMLIDQIALSKEEADTYSNKVIENMINNMSEISNK